MNDFSECYGLPEKLMSNQEKANELSAGCSVSFLLLLGIFSEITRHLLNDRLSALKKTSPKNTFLRHNPIMQRHSTSPPSATTKIRSKTIRLL